MPQTYLIKNKAGDVINTIIAEETFVKDNFDYFEKQKPTNLEVEQDARKWRDAELVSTDNIAIIPDWPNRASYLIYRQTLRDWPSTPDFPDTRPTLGI
jgi:hypothetical protein